VSALAELLEIAPPLSDRRLRANWRQRRWNESRRLKRERDRLELAASRGLISWDAFHILPAQEPQPAPCPECQWLAGGKFCGRVSLPGKSWCSKHARRVFLFAAD
jgi:hypothetical protein